MESELVCQKAWQDEVCDSIGVSMCKFNLQALPLAASAPAETPLSAFSNNADEDELVGAMPLTVEATSECPIPATSTIAGGIESVAETVPSLAVTALSSTVVQVEADEPMPVAVNTALEVGAVATPPVYVTAPLKPAPTIPSSSVKTESADKLPLAETTLHLVSPPVGISNGFDSTESVETGVEFVSGLNATAVVPSNTDLQGECPVDLVGLDLDSRSCRLDTEMVDVETKLLADEKSASSVKTTKRRRSRRGSRKKLLLEKTSKSQTSLTMETTSRTSQEAVRATSGTPLLTPHCEMEEGLAGSQRSGGTLPAETVVSPPTTGIEVQVLSDQPEVACIKSQNPTFVPADSAEAIDLTKPKQSLTPLETEMEVESVDTVPVAEQPVNYVGEVQSVGPLLEIETESVEPTPVTEESALSQTPIAEAPNKAVDEETVEVVAVDTTVEVHAVAAPPVNVTEPPTKTIAQSVSPPGKTGVELHLGVDAAVNISSTTDMKGESSGHLMDTKMVDADTKLLVKETLDTSSETTKRRKIRRGSRKRRPKKQKVSLEKTSAPPTSQAATCDAPLPTQFIEADEASAGAEQLTGTARSKPSVSLLIPAEIDLQAFEIQPEVACVQFLTATPVLPDCAEIIDLAEAKQLTPPNSELEAESIEHGVAVKKSSSSQTLVVEPSKIAYEKDSAFQTESEMAASANVTSGTDFQGKSPTDLVDKCRRDLNAEMVDVETKLLVDEKPTASVETTKRRRSRRRSRKSAARKEQLALDKTDAPLKSKAVEASPLTTPCIEVEDGPGGDEQPTKVSRRETSVSLPTTPEIDLQACEIQPEVACVQSLSAAPALPDCAEDVDLAEAKQFAPPNSILETESIERAAVVETSSSSQTLVAESSKKASEKDAAVVLAELAFGMLRTAVEVVPSPSGVITESLMETAPQSLSPAIDTGTRLGVTELAETAPELMLVASPNLDMEVDDIEAADTPVEEEVVAKAAGNPFYNAVEVPAVDSLPEMDAEPSLVAVVSVPSKTAVAEPSNSAADVEEVDALVGECIVAANTAVEVEAASSTPVFVDEPLKPAIAGSFSAFQTELEMAASANVTSGTDFQGKSPTDLVDKCRRDLNAGMVDVETKLLVDEKPTASVETTKRRRSRRRSRKSAARKEQLALDKTNTPLKSKAVEASPLTTPCIEVEDGPGGDEQPTKVSRRETSVSLPTTPEIDLQACEIQAEVACVQSLTPTPAPPDCAEDVVLAEAKQLVAPPKFEMEVDDMEAADAPTEEEGAAKASGNPSYNAVEVQAVDPVPEMDAEPSLVAVVSVPSKTAVAEPSNNAADVEEVDALVGEGIVAANTAVEVEAAASPPVYMDEPLKAVVAGSFSAFQTDSEMATSANARSDTDFQGKSPADLVDKLSHHLDAEMVDVETKLLVDEKPTASVETTKRRRSRRRSRKSAARKEQLALDKTDAPLKSKAVEASPLTTPCIEVEDGPGGDEQPTKVSRRETSVSLPTTPEIDLQACEIQPEVACVQSLSAAPALPDCAEDVDLAEAKQFAPPNSILETESIERAAVVETSSSSQTLVAESSKKASEKDAAVVLAELAFGMLRTAVEVVPSPSGVITESLMETAPQSLSPAIDTGTRLGVTELAETAPELMLVASPNLDMEVDDIEAADTPVEEEVVAKAAGNPFYNAVEVPAVDSLPEMDAEPSLVAVVSVPSKTAVAEPSNSAADVEEVDALVGECIVAANTAVEVEAASSTPVFVDEPLKPAIAGSFSAFQTELEMAASANVTSGTDFQGKSPTDLVDKCRRDLNAGMVDVETKLLVDEKPTASVETTKRRRSRRRSRKSAARKEQLALDKTNTPLKSKAVEASPLTTPCIEVEDGPGGDEQPTKVSRRETSVSLPTTPEIDLQACDIQPEVACVQSLSAAPALPDCAEDVDLAEAKQLAPPNSILETESIERAAVVETSSSSQTLVAESSKKASEKDAAVVLAELAFGMLRTAVEVVPSPSGVITEPLMETAPQSLSPAIDTGTRLGVTELAETVPELMLVASPNLDMEVDDIEAADTPVEEEVVAKAAGNPFYNAVEVPAVDSLPEMDAEPSLVAVVSVPSKTAVAEPSNSAADVEEVDALVGECIVAANTAVEVEAASSTPVFVDEPLKPAIAGSFSAFQTELEMAASANVTSGTDFQGKSPTDLVDKCRRDLNAGMVDVETKLLVDEKPTASVETTKRRRSRRRSRKSAARKEQLALDKTNTPLKSKAVEASPLTTPCIEVEDGPGGDEQPTKVSRRETSVSLPTTPEIDLQACDIQPEVACVQSLTPTPAPPDCAEDVVLAEAKQLVAPPKFEMEVDDMEAADAPTEEEGAAKASGNPSYNAVEVQAVDPVPEMDAEPSLVAVVSVPSKTAVAEPSNNAADVEEVDALVGEGIVAANTAVEVEAAASPPVYMDEPLKAVVAGSFSAFQTDSEMATSANARSDTDFQGKSPADLVDKLSHHLDAEMVDVETKLLVDEKPTASVETTKRRRSRRRSRKSAARKEQLALDKTDAPLKSKAVEASPLTTPCIEVEDGPGGDEQPTKVSRRETSVSLPTTPEIDLQACEIQPEVACVQSLSAAPALPDCAEDVDLAEAKQFAPPNSILETESIERAAVVETSSSSQTLVAESSKKASEKDAAVVLAELAFGMLRTAVEVVPSPSGVITESLMETAPQSLSPAIDTGPRLGMTALAETAPGLMLEGTANVSSNTAREGESSAQLVDSASIHLKKASTPPTRNPATTCIEADMEAVDVLVEEEVVAANTDVEVETATSPPACVNGPLEVVLAEPCSSIKTELEMGATTGKNCADLLDNRTNLNKEIVDVKTKLVVDEKPASNIEATKHLRKRSRSSRKKAFRKQRLQLEKTITPLISNAVEVTPSTSQVAVTLTSDAPSAKFCIELENGSAAAEQLTRTTQSGTSVSLPATPGIEVQASDSLTEVACVQLSTPLASPSCSAEGEKTPVAEAAKYVVLPEMEVESIEPAPVAVTSTSFQTLIAEPPNNVFVVETVDGLGEGKSDDTVVEVQAAFAPQVCTTKVLAENAPQPASPPVGTAESVETGVELVLGVDEPSVANDVQGEGSTRLVENYSCNLDTEMVAVETKVLVDKKPYGCFLPPSTNTENELSVITMPEGLPGSSLVDETPSLTASENAIVVGSVVVEIGSLDSLPSEGPVSFVGWKSSDSKMSDQKPLGSGNPSVRKVTPTLRSQRSSCKRDSRKSRVMQDQAKPESDTSSIICNTLGTITKPDELEFGSSSHQLVPETVISYIPVCPPAISDINIDIAGGLPFAQTTSVENCPSPSFNKEGMAKISSETQVEIEVENGAPLVLTSSANAEERKSAKDNLKTVVDTQNVERKAEKVHVETSPFQTQKLGSNEFKRGKKRKRSSCNKGLEVDSVAAYVEVTTSPVTEGVELTKNALVPNQAAKAVMECSLPVGETASTVPSIILVSNYPVEAMLECALPLNETAPTVQTDTPVTNQAAEDMLECVLPVGETAPTMASDTLVSYQAAKAMLECAFSVGETAPSVPSNTLCMKQEAEAMLECVLPVGEKAPTVPSNNLLTKQGAEAVLECGLPVGETAPIVPSDSLVSYQAAKAMLECAFSVGETAPSLPSNTLRTKQEAEAMLECALPVGETAPTVPSNNLLMKQGAEAMFECALPVGETAPTMASDTLVSYEAAKAMLECAFSVGETAPSVPSNTLCTKQEAEAMLECALPVGENAPTVPSNNLLTKQGAEAMLECALPVGETAPIVPSNNLLTKQGAEAVLECALPVGETAPTVPSNNLLMKQGAEAVLECGLPVGETAPVVPSDTLVSYQAAKAMLECAFSVGETAPSVPNNTLRTKQEAEAMLECVLPVGENAPTVPSNNLLTKQGAEAVLECGLPVGETAPIVPSDTLVSYQAAKAMLECAFSVGETAPSVPSNTLRTKQEAEAVLECELPVGENAPTVPSNNLLTKQGAEAMLECALPVGETAPIVPSDSLVSYQAAKAMLECAFSVGETAPSVPSNTLRTKQEAEAMLECALPVGESAPTVPSNTLCTKQEAEAVLECALPVGETASNVPSYTLLTKEAAKSFMECALPVDETAPTVSSNALVKNQPTEAMMECALPIGETVVTLTSNALGELKQTSFGAPVYSTVGEIKQTRKRKRSDLESVDRDPQKSSQKEDGCEDSHKVDSEMVDEIIKPLEKKKRGQRSKSKKASQKSSYKKLQLIPQRSERDSIAVASSSTEVLPDQSRTTESDSSPVLPETEMVCMGGTSQLNSSVIVISNKAAEMRAFLEGVTAPSLSNCTITPNQAIETESVACFGAIVQFIEVNWLV